MNVAGRHEASYQGMTRARRDGNIGATGNLHQAQRVGQS